jgi:hypothetical protein
VGSDSNSRLVPFRLDDYSQSVIFILRIVVIFGLIPFGFRLRSVHDIDGVGVGVLLKFYLLLEERVQEGEGPRLSWMYGLAM